MSLLPKDYWRSQSGYTLVEVIVASAITMIVMVGLTSVILTSVRAANIANSRLQASSQIRNFELRAIDDFARSSLPANSSGCPCSSAIQLTGTQVSNTNNPVPAPYQVTYALVAGGFVDRQVGANSVHLSTNVTSFSWFVDGSAPNQTVVVNLTVAVLGYSESQTMRFYPRLTP
jgi:type II secretory pathway pseudopilin PulG